MLSFSFLTLWSPDDNISEAVNVLWHIRQGVVQAKLPAYRAQQVEEGLVLAASLHMQDTPVHRDWP